VGIYDRVSTKQQAEEGTSLEDQRDRLRRRAAQEGWEIVVERADAGVDGDLPFAERPGAVDIVAACERGEVDVVLATDVDRFGRDTIETLSAARDLKRAGVGLILVDNGIDTRHGGELELDIRAAIAAEEKRKILERTRRGLRARAAAGEWTGGSPPFGFKPEAPVEGARRRLVIYEEEAAVLRKAVSLVLDDGCSTWTAARTLNGLGLLPRRTPRWEHTQLRRALSAPTLSGHWSYGTGPDAIEIAIPPIIEPERHAAVLDALGGWSLKGPRREVYYPLSHGILHGLCGAPMHGMSRPDREYRVYRCYNGRTESDERCPDQVFDAGKIEAAVWREVVALLSEPDRLLAMAEAHLDERGDRLDVDRAELASIDRKLTSLAQARTERVTAALKAGIDAGILAAAVSEIEAEEAALRTHRDHLAAFAKHADAEGERVEQLRALADTARDRLGAMDDRERREVLGLLNVQVRVTGWHICRTCHGRGRLRGGGKGGRRCPDCHAARNVPALRLTGEVLDLRQLTTSAPPRTA
jgi:DNA invertase Pin-like site-specific DNA recombinase